MATVDIFGTKGCPYVHRSRLVMLEKGIDFDFTIVDTKNKPDWFLRISPYGKVPVIRHGDTVLYESAIINEYLDETFPAKRLMPADAAARARVRIWVDYCNTRFIPAVGTLRESKAGAERDKARSAVVACLRFMEIEGFSKLSAKGPYWLGTEPTLVDFTYYPHVERLAPVKHYCGLEIPDDCPRFNAWYAAMCERPSVKKTATPAATWIERYADRFAAAAQ
jgi:glutathione S-transferase